MNKKIIVPVLLPFVTLTMFHSNYAKAQDLVQSENPFREVFVTAGYSAAFGAATGAAILAFVGEPQKNYRLVVGGAAAGFVAGSAYAFYRISASNQRPSYSGQDDTYPVLPPSPPAAQDDVPSGALLLGHGKYFALSIPQISMVNDGYSLALAKLRF